MSKITAEFLNELGFGNNSQKSENKTKNTGTKITGEWLRENMSEHLQTPDPLKVNIDKRQPVYNNGKKIFDEYYVYRPSNPIDPVVVIPKVASLYNPNNPLLQNKILSDSEAVEAYKKYGVYYEKFTQLDLLNGAVTKYVEDLETADEGKLKEKDFFQKAHEYKYRKDQQTAEKLLNDTETPEWFNKFSAAVSSGLNQTLKGLNSIGKPYNMPTSPYPNAIEIFASETRKDMNKLEGFMFDMVQNISANAPMMATGIAGGSFLANAAQFASSFGNDLEYAKKKGVSADKAYTYAFLDGLQQALLDSALSSLPGIGKLSSKAGTAVLKNVKNAVLRFLGKSAVSFGSESLTEAVQTSIENTLKNTFLDEHNDTSLFSEEALYSALLGGVTGFTLNIPSSFSFAKATATGNKILKQGNVDALIDSALQKGKQNNQDALVSFAEELQAKKKEGKKIDPSDIGYLAKGMSVAAVKSTKNALISELENSAKQFGIDDKLVSKLGAVATTTGTHVQFTDTLTGENATYNPEKNLLLISKDNTNPIFSLIKHEIVHSIRNTSQYTRLVSLVKSSPQMARLLENFGITFDNYVDYKIQEYREKGKFEEYEPGSAEERDAAVEEIVANFAATYYYSDEVAIKSLFKIDRPMFYRFLYGIRQGIKRIGPNRAEAKPLIEAEKLYKKAMEQKAEQFYKTGRKEWDASDTRPTAASVGTTDVEEDISNAVDITKEDVVELRSIGKKSVNQFTSEEIQKSQSWAKKFHRELGIKSPFFRAWFGDWREYDLKPYLAVTSTQATIFSAGKETNNDTQKVISWSRDIRGETVNHAVKSKKAIIAVNDIADIVKNAIYFDTVVSIPTSKSKMPNTAFMHSYYSIYETETGRYLLKLYVEEALSNDASSVFNRAYQLKDIEKVEDIPNGVHSANGSLTDETPTTINSVSDLFAVVKKYDKDFHPNPVNSILLNDDGTPKVVYHGTNGNFYVFNDSENGYWFSESEDYAEEMAHERNGDRVIPCYLNIRKPYVVTLKATEFNNPTFETQHIQYAKQNGYDGVVFQNENSNPLVGDTFYVVFDKTQIKSATENIGTFDGENPEIRYSIGHTDLEADIQALVEKYGAISKGMKPERDVSIPQSTDGESRVMRAARTMAESKSALTDETVNVLYEQVLDGAMNYTQTTNKKELEYAAEILADKGYETALDKWNAAQVPDAAVSGNMYALGVALLQEAGKRGDTQTVMQLTVDLAVNAKNGGQVVQAVTLLKKATPEWRLYYLQKVVDKTNSKGVKKLSAADQQRADALRQKIRKAERSGADVRTLDFLRSELNLLDGTVYIPSQVVDNILSQTTKEGLDAAFDDALVEIAHQKPATWEQKWNQWRYFAMLANPRTHIKNFLGNLVFAPVVQTKDFIKFALESAFQSKLETRTASFKNHFRIEKRYRDFVYKDFEEQVEIIAGNGKHNPSDIIRDNQQIFKTKPLEWLRKKNSDLLEAEDRVAMRIHYTRALAQYLSSNNIDPETCGTKVLNRARAYAIQEAQKGTFRDESKIADFLSQLAQTNAATNLLVESVVPFKKTPINVVKRGLEYSPVGFVAAAIDLGKMKHGNSNITLNDVLDKIASGITGSMLLALGVFLASKGILKGKKDEKEKKAEYDSVTGSQEYSIETTEGSYTIDWLAPAALPLFVGVELYNSLTDDEEMTLGEILESLTSITEPIVDLSMLQGVHNTIKSLTYGNPISTAITSGVTSYISQAIPTALGQVARIFDDTRRENYVEDGTSFSGMQHTIQKAMGKIPGLENQKKEYVNQWGETENTGGIVQRIFQNSFSPGNYRKKRNSDMEKEIERLYESTKDTVVLPSSGVTSFSYSGEEYTMTADENTAYMKKRGGIAYDFLTKITSDDTYQKMDDEQKKYAVEKVYEYAKEKAQKTVVEGRGQTYKLAPLAQKIESCISSGGEINDYFLFSYWSGNTESDKNSKGESINGSKKRKIIKQARDLGYSNDEIRMYLKLLGYSGKLS